MEHCTLTRHEGLPAGTDIAALLHDLPSYRSLLAVLTTYHYNRTDQEGLARLDAGQTHDTAPDPLRKAFQADIAEHAAVTPAQALEANRQLVDVLTIARRRIVQDAREAGDSWTGIGDALGMTEQDARDRYEQKIAG